MDDYGIPLLYSILTTRGLPSTQEKNEKKFKRQREVCLAALL